MGATDVFGAVFRAWPLVVGYLVVLGPFALITFWRIRRRRKMIKAGKAAGTIVQVGGIFSQKLPFHYAALSSIGTGGPAPMTLDDHILRPALGLKVFILGLTSAIAVFVFSHDLAPVGFHEAMEELPGPTLIPQLLMLLAAGNGLFYVFGCETRYNRDRLITTRMMFNRREYRWKDLDWIGDTGAYDLVLHFQTGGKAKVLKHCRGIEDFKMYAQEQIRKNRAAGA
jgi:hypothetical protein